jgi:hypothetical protein
MLLEPWYRVTFSTPESWRVQLSGAHGTEGQSFLIAEGRAEGRVSARYLAANYPRTRTDGALLPDFRGALETDEGATILFSWHGVLRTGDADARELVGSITHLTKDERYRWLNDRVGAVNGEVRPGPGDGFHVVLEISGLVWEQVP